MAVISVTFTPRASMAYDPDDPLVHQLFSEMVDRDEYLYEWLGKDYDAGVTNHNHDSVNSAPIQTTVAAGDYLYKSVGNKTGSATAYTKIAEVVLSVNGELRIKWDQTGQEVDLTTSVDGDSWARVYRNGVAVGIEHQFDYPADGTNYGDTISVSEDISGWSKGDLLQIYAKIETASARNVKVKDLTIYSDTVLEPIINL